MRRGSAIRSAAAVLVGSLVAAGLGWGLLNVPESNVLALTLSAALVLLIAITIGLTLSTAAATPSSPSLSVAVRRGVSALPTFIVGVFLFAALWWLTGAAGDWWSAHRGEVDAAFIRYLGATGTQPLHTGVLWIIWLLRWALGSSIVVALAAEGVHDGLRGVGRGLRLSVRLVPLVAATIGIVFVSQGLWRVAYWRPAGLPATGVEIVFAVVKLGILYLLAVSVATIVLRMYGRAAARSVSCG